MSHKHELVFDICDDGVMRVKCLRCDKVNVEIPLETEAEIDDEVMENPPVGPWVEMRKSALSLEETKDQSPAFWMRGIQVTVHEKRNNPCAYGHYDCEVRYEVDTDSEISMPEVTELTRRLRVKARKQVQAECNAWEEKVRHESSFFDDEEVIF